MGRDIQIEIGFNGEAVTIPLSVYEALLRDSQNLKDIKGYEKHLTRMFDSDARVGLAILDKIRKK